MDIYMLKKLSNNPRVLTQTTFLRQMQQDVVYKQKSIRPLSIPLESSCYDMTM